MTRVKITFHYSNSEDLNSPHKTPDSESYTYGSIENPATDFLSGVLPLEKYPKTYENLAGKIEDLVSETGDVCCNYTEELPEELRCCRGKYFSHFSKPIRIELVLDEIWERAEQILKKRRESIEKMRVRYMEQYLGNK